eukprot:1221818-Pleurochrysis_carterae.AAC.3
MSTRSMFVKLQQFKTQRELTASFNEESWRVARLQLWPRWAVASFFKSASTVELKRNGAESFPPPDLSQETYPEVPRTPSLDRIPGSPAGSQAPSEPQASASAAPAAGPAAAAEGTDAAPSDPSKCALQTLRAQHTYHGMLLHESRYLMSPAMSPPPSLPAYLPRSLSPLPFALPLRFLRSLSNLAPTPFNACFFLSFCFAFALLLCLSNLSNLMECSRICTHASPFVTQSPGHLPTDPLCGRVRVHACVKRTDVHI